MNKKYDIVLALVIFVVAVCGIAVLSHTGSGESSTSKENSYQEATDAEPDIKLSEAVTATGEDEKIDASSKETLSVETLSQ